MKFKNLVLLCLFRYLSMFGLLLFIIFSTISIQAQDFPLILERNTDYSPRNINDFKQLVDNYKSAICFRETIEASSKNKIASTTSSCSPDEAAAIKARNSLIYATLTQIDLNFTKYQRNTRRKKVIFETLMDFLVIAGDTASIITNGVRPKNIINAGSALLQLSRESVNKNLRLEETQALFNQMEANRLKVLALILPKITGADKLGIIDYPFEAAWLDIVAYYRAGTWDNALSNIAANTAKEKEVAEIKIQGFKPSPLATREEVEFADGSARTLIKLDRQLAIATDQKVATEKLQNIVIKLEADENIKKILSDNKLSSTDKGDDIMSKLVDIRSNLRTFQNFSALNKINRIISEVGLEK